MTTERTKGQPWQEPTNHLLEENEKLKATVKELEQFVHIVAHDVKAPLSSLFGLLKLAKHPETTPDLLDQYLDLMNQSIVQMDTFLQDLIHYSRNLRSEVSSMEINVREVVEDVFQNLNYMMGNDGVNFDIAENSLSVYTDYMRLKMILNNLISNAIYYSSEADKPLVSVDFYRENGHLNITVKDNGIGIDEKHQEEIFEMFYRVSSAGKGSGLGLYIVKEAVEKLGGEINLDSELGKGSTFEVLIPLKEKAVSKKE